MKLKFIGTSSGQTNPNRNHSAILFENNSSVVKEDTKEKVLAFAKYLVDNKEFKTVITGHASKENRTSALYNQKLSFP